MQFLKVSRHQPVALSAYPRRNKNQNRRNNYRISPVSDSHYLYHRTILR